jgi:integrase
MKGPPDALLFPTRRGTLRKHWNAADLLRRAAKRAGVALPVGFVFHDLRKTFATAVLRATGNVVAAQRLLGHSSPRVTEAYYVGREGKVLEDAVSALRLVDGHATDTRDSATPTKQASGAQEGK